MKQQFDAFIDDLRTTHGKNLASVILYGSAAAGDFVPRQSDYNLLVALHRITPKDLRNANACMREWNKMGRSMPVYFTVSELQNTRRTFSRLSFTIWNAPAKFFTALMFWRI